MFNPQRRVVTKCDLCQPRLATGDQPRLRRRLPDPCHQGGKGQHRRMARRPPPSRRPGPAVVGHHACRPPGSSFPRRCPPAPARAADERVEPADPHWPLIARDPADPAVARRAGGHRGPAGPRRRPPGAAGGRGRGGGRWRWPWRCRSCTWAGPPWRGRRCATCAAPGCRGRWRCSAPSRSPPSPTPRLRILGGRSGRLLLALGVAAVALGAAGVYASGRLYLVPGPAGVELGAHRRGLLRHRPRHRAAGGGAVAARRATAGCPSAVRRGREPAASSSSGAIQHLVAVDRGPAGAGVRPQRPPALRAFPPAVRRRGRRRRWPRPRCVCWRRSRSARRVAGPGLVALVVLAVAGAGELIGRYLFFVTVDPDDCGPAVLRRGTHVVSRRSGVSPVPGWASAPMPTIPLRHRRALRGGVASPASPSSWVSTTCGYCSVGCGMLIGVRDGAAVAVRGDPDHPVNQGRLCPKGLSEHHTIAAPRPVAPAAHAHRRRQPLSPTTWDDALDRVGRRVPRASWPSTVPTRSPS